MGLGQKNVAPNGGHTAACPSRALMADTQSCFLPRVPLFYSQLAIIILGFHAILHYTITEGLPPLEPVECDSHSCQVSNAYGEWPDRLPCKATRVVYPTSEAEIVAVVAAAVKAKQKIKVVSKLAHSSPKLVCPGGSQGLLISTRDFNRELIVDRKRMTVAVDGGMGLRQVLDGVAMHGLALGAAPLWEGVSIAGLLSSGTHGSSFHGRGGAVHDYVVGIRLIVPATEAEGYAKVIELTEADEELNAAKVSLGVLGVISKVVLQLEPMFKRSITYQSMSDKDLKERVLPFASEHEFGEITWHPSQQRAVYRVDDRVVVNAPGDGVFDFTAFQPLSPILLGTLRSTENVLQASNYMQGMCITSRLQTTAVEAIGNGLKRNDESGFDGYPVVGYQHHMQTSGSCTTAPANDSRVCPWDRRANGLFFFETSVHIAVSKIQEFIQDVELLRDEVKSQSLCGIDMYQGIFLRYVKASSAFMGNPEDAVGLDIAYYRAREIGQPRVMEDVIEEIEQMAVFKYGGWPHWAKNRVVAFKNVAAKYPNLRRFLAVKDEWDPDALFSSEWSDFLLGRVAAQGDSPGCALEGLCLCSSDMHCAPELGYLCVAGRVYQEARVCRKVAEH